jgi:hypothetical protein
MTLLMILAVAGTISGSVSGALLGGGEGLILGASSGLVVGAGVWLLTASALAALHEYRLNRHFTQDSRDERG